MHQLRLGPGHAPIFADARRDRRKSALVVSQAQKANPARGVLGRGGLIRMIGQLDQSRRRAGAEWLVEKGSEDLSATVMRPEDQFAIEEGGLHIEVHSFADQDDFATGRGWGAEAPVVRRTRCTAGQGDQQQRAPAAPRGSGMVCPCQASRRRASVCASSRDIRTSPHISQGYEAPAGNRSNFAQAQITKLSKAHD